jgi:hypothetical protein
LSPDRTTETSRCKPPKRSSLGALRQTRADASTKMNRTPPLRQGRRQREAAAARQEMAVSPTSRRGGCTKPLSLAATVDREGRATSPLLLHATPPHHHDRPGEAQRSRTLSTGKMDGGRRHRPIEGGVGRRHHDLLHRRSSATAETTLSPDLAGQIRGTPPLTARSPLLHEANN